MMEHQSTTMCSIVLEMKIEVWRFKNYEEHKNISMTDIIIIVIIIFTVATMILMIIIMMIRV